MGPPGAPPFPRPPGMGPPPGFPNSQSFFSLQNIRLAGINVSLHV